MRKELICKQAVAIAEICSEIKKQHAQIKQLSKKNLTESRFDTLDRKLVMIVRVIAGCYAIGACLAACLLLRADPLKKTENAMLSGILLVYAALLVAALDAGDVLKRERLGLWRKKAVFLGSVNFSDILDAMESLEKNVIKIPDEFICPVTHNIITYPVYIIDRETNKKLPGVYEKSQLIFWLTRPMSRIPSINIRFHARKHAVIDDPETALKIHDFMEEKLQAYSANKKAQGSRLYDYLL
jgi:hypothetical protein